MGKRGKLRCFFGFGKSKRSNSKPINSEASLSGLLQKCPAHPNQYFSNGRDQDTLVIEDKSSKMEVTEQTRSLKRKEEGMCAIESEMRFFNANMIGGISSSNHEIQEGGVNHSSNSDKQPRLGVDGLRTNDRCLNAAYSAKLTVHDPEHIRVDNKSQPIQHTDDPFPGAGRERQPARSTKPDIHSHSNSAPVCQSDLVNFNKPDDESVQCVNDSSEWNASGACKVSRMKTSEATSAIASDCLCSDCVASDSVKDYDWGWLTNSSKPEKQSDGRRSKSSVSDTIPHPCSHEIQLHTYVNDSTPRQTFRLSHSSASLGLNDVFVYSHSSSPSSGWNPDEEVAFTIAERTGRNIQVTFTRKVRHSQHSHCRSDSFSNRRSRSSIGSSTSCQHCSPEETSSSFMIWEPTSDKPNLEQDNLNKYSRNNPIGHQCKLDLESFQSASKSMAPSFSTQVKNKMSDESSQGLGRHNSVQKTKMHLLSAKPSSNHRAYVPTKREERAPHFELSIASYSKLINYFDTNKILVRQGSAERDVNDNVNSFNNSSYSANASNQSSVVSTSSNRRYHQSTARSRRSPSPTRYSIPNNAIVVDKLCRLVKVLQTVEECSWYWGSMTGQDSRAELRNSPTGTFLLRDSSDPRYLFSLSVKTHQGPTSIRIVYSDGTFRFDSDSEGVDANAHRQHSARHSDQHNHPNYVKRLTPVFTCVINMILFYTKHLGASTTRSRSSRAHSKMHGRESERQGVNMNNKTEGNPISSSVEPTKEQFMCYWVNSNGRQEIPIMLSKPKSRHFPSLQHLCRQTLSASEKLWMNEGKIDQLPLPNKLKRYIKTYPYPI